MSDVMAPFDGAILGLDQFSDLVFRDELVGSGIGLRPDESIETLRVHSPMAGTVLKTLPHAFIVLNGDVGVLVHIGIDTVKLNGEGLTPLVEEGQIVQAGELCYEVDANAIRASGYSLDTPIVVMDSPKGTYSTDRRGARVTQGERLLTI